jgi:hypothetical protein
MKLSGAGFMKPLGLLVLLAVSIAVVPAQFAQTQKPLTNADIVNMTAQGFEAPLIVKDIQSSSTDFDTSPQALINLKNAGVDKSVLEAMLAAQSAKPSGTVEAVHGGATTDPSQPSCSNKTGGLLKEGDAVALNFAADLNSKTAHEGGPVEFLLDDDLKVAGSIVVPKGAHAVATVTDAKKAGMMGDQENSAFQCNTWFPARTTCEFSAPKVTRETVRQAQPSR